LEEEEEAKILYYRKEAGGRVLELKETKLFYFTRGLSIEIKISSFHFGLLNQKRHGGKPQKDQIDCILMLLFKKDAEKCESDYLS